MRNVCFIMGNKCLWLVSGGAEEFVHLFCDEFVCGIEVYLFDVAVEEVDDFLFVGHFVSVDVGYALVVCVFALG